MTRWMAIVSTLVLCLVVVACAGPGDDTGTSDPLDDTFALTNTTHYSPSGLLRGQGVKLFTDGTLEQLDPSAVYDILITNDNTGDVLNDGGRTQVRTTDDQAIEPYDLLFDVGQDDNISEGDNIRVSITNDEGVTIESVISLSVLRLPGWDMDEIEASEVYACDQLGNQANAFAVGGQDPGEVVGEVYITGTFPVLLDGETVNVSIVQARDSWLDTESDIAVPLNAEAGLIYSVPIVLDLDAEGNLAPTATGFVPDLEDVGIYDILVDTDADGLMEWGPNTKDAGDGVDEQVGFTVQYSQAWIRARGERHILVNMAFSAESRDGGQFLNDYAGDAPVYTYLNPPVMYQYHFSVSKWLVRHQDFETFWNNPDMETGPNGCIPFEQYAVQSLGVPVQRGCTNTGPVHWGPAAMLAPDGEAFDVVFDRNDDGCYAPGEDLLDVVGGANTSGDLVTWEQFSAMDPADQVGFRVLP